MHCNHVLLQIYTKTLANKNSYLTANTFYTEDIINTSEVTEFTSMQPSNLCSLTVCQQATEVQQISI